MRHLFIGSEGTLGFITEATLQLTKLPGNTGVFLMLVNSDEHIIDILNEFNSAISVTAFEFFSRCAIEHVIAATGLREPSTSKSPFYIILEFESSELNDQLAMNVGEKLMNLKWLEDVIMSDNMKQAEALWRYRDAISMSISKYTPYKFDIAVLPSKVVSFMSEVNDLFHAKNLDFEVVWFGHVGDGNLHLNLLKPPQLTKDEFFSCCDQLGEALFEIIGRYHGAISAEHGVGLLKKDFLHYTKSQLEIDYMRSIKMVFDPNGVMNPGKIFN